MQGKEDFRCGSWEISFLEEDRQLRHACQWGRKTPAYLTHRMCCPQAMRFCENSLGGWPARVSLDSSAITGLNSKTLSGPYRRGSAQVQNSPEREWEESYRNKSGRRGRTFLSPDEDIHCTQITAQFFTECFHLNIHYRTQSWLFTSLTTFIFKLSIFRLLLPLVIQTGQMALVIHKSQAILHFTIYPFKQCCSF